jgi:hypothetical protein
VHLRRLERTHDALRRQLPEDLDPRPLAEEGRRQTVEAAQLGILRRVRHALVQRAHELPDCRLVDRRCQRDGRAGARLHRRSYAVRQTDLCTEAARHEAPGAVGEDQLHGPRERRPQGRLCLLVRHAADGHAGNRHAARHERRPRRIPAQHGCENRDDEDDDPETAHHAY